MKKMLKLKFLFLSLIIVVVLITTTSIVFASLQGVNGVLTIGTTNETVKILSRALFGVGIVDNNYNITTSGGGIKAESVSTPAGYFNSTTGYGLLVDKGNVGIGTLAPGHKLNISDTGDTAMIRIENKNAQPKYTGLRLDRNGLVEKWFIGMDDSTNDNFIVRRNNSAPDVLTIDSSNGNVGIGTTTPTSKLQVVGLLEYADSAAASAAGLSAGAFYRTGDTVKVVVTRKLIIGESYGGGIVFWVDASGEHGLIAATSDQSTGIRWYNGTYTTTNATNDGVYLGKQNTVLIITSQGAGSYAAQICADYRGGGYDGWYLPSKDELNLLYQQKGVVGITTGWYWSSSEGSASYAWGKSFYSGFQLYGLKSDTYGVRAVRAF